jgi:hypothetical protein
MRLHAASFYFCLLYQQVCSPIDAWEHYVNSINECRSYNDTMWLAGSLEGSVTTMLSLLQHGAEMEEELLLLVKDVKTLVANGTVPSNQAAVVRLSEDRCAEALALYSKNIAWCVMEAGCCLRLAKIHEMLNTAMSDKQLKVSACRTCDAQMTDALDCRLWSLS